MIHEPDFCPLEFTREQLSHHAAMVAFYEPIANASGPDSLATRALHRHRGLVEFLAAQYHEALDAEALSNETPS